MSATDIVTDIISRVLAAYRRDGNLTDDLAREVSRQVHQDWGGVDVYIPKQGEDDRLAIGQRNAAIIRDLNNGERVCLVARRYRISRRMVYKVLDAYVIQRRRVTVSP